ncbi:amidohydrolase family protein [Negadavirga shengliensis]|uniref:Amidohydrolase family protein n=1 Tax=Negadavirga shengliensis TaxID=1389218 RepID=A0ABV9T1H0_9BACT
MKTEIFVVQKGHVTRNRVPQGEKPVFSTFWLRYLLMVLLTPAFFMGCAPAVDTSITTILRNCTLIDGTGNPPVQEAVVALAGDRIAYAGPISDAPRAPADADVIDLSGKFVIPGLIDMHAHIDQGRYAPKFLAQLVAFGITTVRAPSNPVVELRERVRKGEIVGPDLYLAGILINGPLSFYGQRGETEDDYRAIVANDAKKGVKFVKVYAGLPPNLTEVVIDEAHRQGLRVIGHLGETSWTQAANAGIDAITHSWYSGLIDEVIPAAYREEFADFYIPPGPNGFNPNLFARWSEIVDVRGPEVMSLADLLKEHGIDIDPTLVLGEAMTWGNDPTVLERLEPDLAMPGQAETWRSGPFPYSSSWTEEQFSAAQEAWPLMLEIVRVFHERGVLLTTGTDLLNPWMTPGVTLHREMELLVSSGIPPLEVLSIATRNGAVALGIENETGTVNAGKRADLVILSADPTLSISNTREIESVFLSGTRYDPNTLLQIQPDPVQ